MNKTEETEISERAAWDLCQHRDEVDELLGYGYTIYASREEVVDSWLDEMSVHDEVRYFIDYDEVYASLEDAWTLIPVDGYVVEFHEI